MSRWAATEASIMAAQAAAVEAAKYEQYAGQERGGQVSDAESRNMEALRILRQVETEVRTLKRWYTEAIDTMRAGATISIATKTIAAGAGPHAHLAVPTLAAERPAV